jgi:mono/diheme cytochrome c family protein
MIQLSICDRSAALARRALGLSLLTLLGLCFFIPALADESGAVKWVAPAAQAQKTNPIAANPASIEAGRKIYMQRCAKCHGEAGKGDGPDAVELKLHPAKFTGSSIHDESDGALYWKISVGKKGMPDFGKRLSPNDRWNVINFLRTLGGS